MSATEYKLLFAGPMGAGKTTAITAISDIPPIATEAVNSDRVQYNKESTTVAFDYGEVRMPDGNRLRLYGMPGQSRFDFIWNIAAEGALGVVLLADNSQPGPLAALEQYFRQFESFARNASMVVGVGRSELGGPDPSEYADWFGERGCCIPVFAVDVRRRDDVLLLLDALLSQIEARELLGD